MVPRHKQCLCGYVSFFAGRPDVQFLHVTGQQEYKAVLEKIAQTGVDLQAATNIRVEPYLYDMPSALATADLAVSCGSHRTGEIDSPGNRSDPRALSIRGRESSGTQCQST